MTFPCTIADADLEAAEKYLERSATLISLGVTALSYEDRIIGMVLGAARAAGFGKRKRRAKN